MKHIAFPSTLGILAVSAMVLMSTGCSKDFLDRDPYIGSSAGNFYQTPDDALAATIACYAPLQVEISDGKVYPTISDFTRKYEPSSMKRSETRLFWLRSEWVMRGVSLVDPSPVQRSNAAMGKLVVLRS